MVPVYIAADAKGAAINGPDGNPIVIPTDKDGKLPTVLPPGVAKPIPQPFTLSYQGGITKDDKTGIETYNYHESAKSVIAPHKFSYVMIQACVAILILVGFESVTAMGEEAKNPKKDIPRSRAVVADYPRRLLLRPRILRGQLFLAQRLSGDGATPAASSAPLGDMMQMVGAWAFGSAKAGWWFMMIQAITVFLALIGTTLSCLSTGARVTYAMGRDEEVPNHFGLLHGKNFTPHTAIWTLAIISGVLGCLTVATYYCGPAINGGTKDAYNATVSGLPNNFWYSIGTHKLSFETRQCHSAEPVDDHPDQQLRHVPSLHDYLRGRHRGLPRTP